MKILVTGISGQVGSEVYKLFVAQGYIVKGLVRNELDITNFAAVAAQFAQFKPDFVINCAAYTAVDRAESEPELAQQINHYAVENLALLCKQFGCALVHLSTDYIFDGTKATPYRESDAPNPLSVYGLSKLNGETAIQKYLPEHIILRVSWVFGLNGHNFVRTMLRLAEQRSEISVVADQIGAPTFASDIAAVIMTLIRQPQWGIFNFGNQPYTSWYKFAEEIFAAAQVSVTLVPILSQEYVTPAKRPANSCLDYSKIAKCYALQPRPWAAGVQQFLNSVQVCQ